ncbi:MAG: dihydroorotate dehydrogenase electron transfer subunit [Desulfobacteraceae bacterium]|jgi:dihydroorotate dehydrogenase electron transfer subunit
MRQAQASILYNDAIGPAYFRMGIAWPGEASEPGQFVMVQVADRGGILLRRPFSVSALIRSNGKLIGIELLYKVVGAGTLLMSQGRKDDQLDVLGPLGKGFDWKNFSGSNYLVAGGIGVAPIRFLAEHLAGMGRNIDHCHVFLGGRSREDLLCTQDFERLAIPVTLTTDDGSAGDHCLVTHPLDVAVQRNRPNAIYACGPTPMLACVAGIARKHQVPCYVSIETIMACGMGACLGCAMVSRKDTDRYLHACLDGPVFDVNQLKF